MPFTENTDMSDKAGNPGEQPVCRILLVDDDAGFLALCQRYLRRSTSLQFKVDVAENAQSALQLCREVMYDCLIVDYRLPEMTGTQLLLQLREEHSEHTLAPAIIMTAFGGESVAIDAFRAEAADYMSKSDVTRTSLSRAIDNAQSKAQLKRTVHKSNETLRQAHEELKKKIEETTRFYHTLSHEVKTPLTAIHEFTSLLRDEIVGPLNEEQLQLLRYTSESCEQIARHFDDLLEITRFDTDKVTFNMQAQFPVDLINRCVVGAQGGARKKDITIVVSPSEDLPLLYIDADRIAQVMSNLISNAVKFSYRGTQIRIDATHQPEDGSVTISIHDSGRGIDLEDVDKIFDRMYQVNPCETHDAESGGLGLGLAIARETVRRHDGDITVQSKIGEGSCFCIVLPVLHAQNTHGSASIVAGGN